MIAFCNMNGNLTVILGSTVYELPTRSADQAQTIASRSVNDQVVADLIQIACKASPRIGSRRELEAKDDDRLRVLADKVGYREHRR